MNIGKRNGIFRKRRRYRFNTSEINGRSRRKEKSDDVDSNEWQLERSPSEKKDSLERKDRRTPQLKKENGLSFRQSCMPIESDKSFFVAHHCLTDSCRSLLPSTWRIQLHASFTTTSRFRSVATQCRCLHLSMARETGPCSRFDAYMTAVLHFLTSGSLPELTF